MQLAGQYYCGGGVAAAIGVVAAVNPENSAAGEVALVRQVSDDAQMVELNRRRGLGVAE